MKKHASGVPLKLQNCYGVDFSGSGSFLVTISRDVAVWNIESRVKRYRVHPLSHPSSCAIHPSEREIALKSTSGRIVVIDAESGATLREIDMGRRGEGSNILYSACGEYLVDASWKGHVTVRQAKTGLVEFEKVFPSELIRSVIHCAASDTWLVVHSPKAIALNEAPAPDYLSVWSWPFTAPFDSITALDHDIQAASVSPDGSMLCQVGRDQISMLRLSDKSMIGSVPFKYGGTSFVASWSPDSREVATVERSTALFYSAATLHKTGMYQLDYACDVKYSPSDDSVAIGSWGGGLLLKRNALAQITTQGEEHSH